MSEETYAKLCEPFEHIKHRQQGSATLSYITGEQATTRLNQVLGPDGWEFSIVAHGQSETNAKGQMVMWAHGRLLVHFPTRSVVKEQMGECQTNPGMGEGDARKGAVTDALKKCASLVGVALYLYADEEPASAPAPRRGTNGNGTPLSAFPGSTTLERSAAFLERCKDELGIDAEGIEALLGEKASTRMRRTNEGFEQIYLVLKAKWDDHQGQREPAATLADPPGAGG